MSSRRYDELVRMWEITTYFACYFDDLNVPVFEDIFIITNGQAALLEAIAAKKSQVKIEVRSLQEIHDSGIPVAMAN